MYDYHIQFILDLKMLLNLYVYLLGLNILGYTFLSILY